MRTSIFDIFKIGIGPSSSHTVGPMRAARQWVNELEEAGVLRQVTRVRSELYGSLALTGIGHGTDRAILLGLCGETPEDVDPASIDVTIAGIRARKVLALGKHKSVAFDEARDLVFHRERRLPGHPNGMQFTAFDAADAPLDESIHYSIGGGFIQKEGESASSQPEPLPVPYPFSSAAELLEQANSHNLPIWRLVLANESALRPDAEVVSAILRVWRVMGDCVDRGLNCDGILPGGLNVRRRAMRAVKRIEARPRPDALDAMDWVNAFAMAVNEENAAGGRVVTAPTNGAAGLIPAVGRYYEQFVAGADDDGIVRYLLTAGAVGILCKENASISGAEVGCQGEVGVACSMAAAGLAAALGASNEAVEHAAEIGMEHHLGMTCDPIGGLVQIPCIERNAMGAVKAINACRMATQESEGHKVSLDQVIRTMYQTGLDMQSRYKETALAGLAVNVKDC
jgi:L-serine dehydratase